MWWRVKKTRHAHNLLFTNRIISICEEWRARSMHSSMEGVKSHVAYQLPGQHNFHGKARKAVLLCMYEITMKYPWPYNYPSSNGNSGSFPPVSLSKSDVKRPFIQVIYPFSLSKQPLWVKCFELWVVSCETQRPCKSLKDIIINH